MSRINFILFEDAAWSTLRPLTLTRPVAALRIGILTIREKWEKRLNGKAFYRTREYLREKYPGEEEPSSLWINGSVCPDNNLCEAVESLQAGEVLRKEKTVIAFRTEGEILNPRNEYPETGGVFKEYEGPLIRIEYPYHIFRNNGLELERDFELLTADRQSARLDLHVTVYGKYPLFVEEGAVVEPAVINTDNGPVYIGKEARIMGGCLIRGPFAMCEHAVLKMGAKVYGATTLGPHCKCGGEINNVVLTACSSKAHDGYLGSSVIGEWCNIGAGTSVSNLKNNYAEIKLWDYESSRFRKTGLQFCGLIMGDHSKMGINMMINTGTVVGVGALLYGAGFPRNYIPSFSWGGASGFVPHPFALFLETASLVMLRRGILLDAAETRLLNYLYEHPEG